MPDLDPADPHRANAGRRYSLTVPRKNYTYRGVGYDIFEGDLDHSEIPDGCTCTWSWGPPGFRWERIGAKDTCPWHRAGDTLMAKLRRQQ